MNDFSFNNTLIRDYFYGSDDYIPSGELMYLHEHPLVQPNFISEVEELIVKATTALENKKHNPDSEPIKRLNRLAKSLGEQLPMTKENATKALAIIREVYQLCNRIIG